MNLTGTIKEIQAVLGVTVDGIAGPETWTAIHKRVVGKKSTSPTPPFSGNTVDSRSEKNIATLLPELHPYARSLVERAALIGITIRIISGTRTYEEQNALYAKGRTAPGPKVTNARGGYSNHNFGIAFDIGVFEGSAYLGESPKYKAVGAIGLELGLDWGGNWKSFRDEPHYQLRPVWALGIAESRMLAELRARKDSGMAVFAV
jgi:peptidoglycan L-alanyl-D-glutamate endopeptidase CwlK